MTPMIRVHELVQHYGVKPVLRNVNLEVAEGELLAIMGPNGVGKSTLLATMGGIMSPQRGYVEIEGKRRRSTEEDELAIRRMCVFLPAEGWQPQELSGREYLHGVGQLYSVESERRMEHCEQLLRDFDLMALADAAIGSYSTGQRKKISLAAAFITDARVYLLDEPFSGGLDPDGIDVLKQLLRRMANEQNYTIVITSPVPEIVEHLADRVALLVETNIVACDSIAGLAATAGLPPGSTLMEVYRKLVPKGA